MPASRFRHNRNVFREKQIVTYLEEMPPYCTEYMKWVGDRVSAETRFAYLYTLRQFMLDLIADSGNLSPDALREFQATRFARLTTEDIMNYVNSSYVTDSDTGKAKEIAPAYKNRILAALKLFFDFLKTKYVIDVSPVDSITRAPLNSEFFALSDEQLDTFISGIRDNNLFLVRNDNPDGSQSRQIIPISREVRLRRERTVSRNIAIISVIADAGLTVSETAALNLSSFDYENKSIRYVRSDGKTVSVPYTDRIISAVSEYLHAPAPPIELLERLATATGGKRIFAFCRRNMLAPDIMEQAAAAFHITDPAFLRDVETCASYYRRQGRDSFGPYEYDQSLFLSNRSHRISIRMIEEMIREMSRTYIPAVAETHPITSETLRASYIARIALNDRSRLGVDGHLGLNKVYAARVARNAVKAGH